MTSQAETRNPADYSAGFTRDRGERAIVSGMRTPIDDFIIESSYWHAIGSPGPTGCQEWTGKVSANGYGVWRTTWAHREAWRRSNGPIPKGGYVLHRCDNPVCVNPQHLFLGDAKANARDAVRKGRWNSGGGKKASWRVMLPEGDSRHGPGGYSNYGCRCAICTEAKRVQQAAYMAAHPEARENRTMRQRAHHKAFSALRERYPTEWAALLAAVDGRSAKGRGQARKALREAHLREFREEYERLLGW